MAASDYPEDDDPERMDAIREQAIDWLIRQRDDAMNADDWDSFSDWLAADERHSVAFEAMADADAGLDGLADELKQRINTPAQAISAPPAANDNPLRRFAPLWGGAIAATLIGVLVLLRPVDNPALRHIETAPGEQRVVALQDGITMLLNGASEVEVTQDAATVRVTHGEAAFEITTREPSPLRVEVADLVLVDYGTVFDVILDERSVRVAVAKGAVGVDYGSGSMRVMAGQQVEKALDGQTLTRRPIEGDAVLGWREGRLEFANAPVRQVATDVGRNLGLQIAVSHHLSSRRLTGVLRLSGDERQVVADLAALLGAHARKGGNGWHIE
jgi:transmembrane sensor